MSSALHAAKTPDDLLAHDDPNEPYVWREIFPRSGWLAKRWNKERLKHLKSLDAELRRMLQTGERVHFVTFGHQYSFIEASFLGIWSYLLNKRALVVTDRRVIVLQVDVRRRLMQLKAQIRLGAIQKVAVSFLSQVRVSFLKGGALLFIHVPGADRKLLRERIEALREHAPASPVQTGEYLCPHCFAALEKLALVCPSCRGEFKSPARAGLLSLLFPGLGDLYLGHRMLGVFQMLPAAVLWAVFTTGFVAISNDPTADPAQTTETYIVFAIIVAFLHGLDAAVTHHTARKGLYPHSGHGSKVIR